MSLPVCHTLWTGDQLPPLLASCLDSFVHQGHRVVLHAYRNVDAPRGVDLRDAANVLALQPIGTYHGHGAMAVFSDWFRYELLERVDGLWIDADLICIRPLEKAGPYLFGYESETQIGNAVLGLPSGSALLQHMRELFPGHGFIPPWFGRTRKLRYQIKRLCGVHRDISTLPHGSTGPRALTWYAEVEGVKHNALPVDAFYPLHFLRTRELFDPDFDIASVITRQTRCIHLWHNSLPRLQPDPRSVIGRLMARDFKTVAL